MRGYLVATTSSGWVQKDLPPWVEKASYAVSARTSTPGGYTSQEAGQWIGEVTRTIEAVLAERTGTGPTGGASLWDLFDLCPHNGGVGKLSDRGECLSRLNAKTLTKLRDWLEANQEEAVGKGYKQDRFRGL